MFQAPKMTNAGKALYYDSIAGEGIVFTQIKLGKGTLTQSIANLTDLVDTVLSIDASLAKAPDGSYVDVSGSFSNAGLSQGFYWREIGLYAANPEMPEEREADILYCYQNAYDTADFIPAASVETVEKHITIPIVVSDVSQISCLLDPSLVFATQQDITNHNNSLTAHADIRKKVEELDDAMTAYIEVTDASIDKVKQSLTQHEQNASVHVSMAEKQGWNGKATPQSVEAAIQAHDESATAHPDIRQGVVDAKAAAQTAQDTADTALEAISSILYNIDVVPSQNGTLTFNGSAQSPSWNSFNPDTLTLGGVTSGTNAGTYYATFTPKGEYHWSDGTKTAKSVAWTIGRQAITTIPSQSGTLTYTGSTLTPSWSGYDTSKMTIGGTTSAQNAGNYNATFTPTANYKWSDGSTTEKTVQWKINKAAGSLSINKTSITLTTGATSSVIAVTRAGDGAITAQSSNTSVATVSVSGTNVTVTSVGTNNGSATITIKVAEGTNYLAPANKTCSVTAAFPKIYGVQWDGSSATTWSRTDDAASFTNPVPYVAGASAYSSPFDGLQPWAGMTKVNDSAAGALVAIPKYWYKWTKSGNTMKLQIADRAVSGFSVSPAHADRGDGKGERSIVYVGRYHCVSGYKSATGSQPLASITRATARSGIHALGSTIWQYDFAMYWTIMMLYLVEFADWNGQKTIGYGCSPSGSKWNMGYTDSMPYHTGTTAANRSTYGGTQYRYIEGLWDNVYDWCDGIYFSGANIYCIKNPASFSDSSGGTQTGTRPTSSGYISAWNIPTASGFGYALYPSAVSGSETTYVCDYCYYGSSGVVLFCGGYYGQYQDYGPFYLYGNGSASVSDANIGCRLQKLP